MATPAELLSGLLADLRAESEDLDRLVADLPPASWAAATPAPGWTVAHQIAHLAWTDGQALLAAAEPEAFRREAERFPDGSQGDSETGGAAHLIDEAAEEGARLPHAELLHRWRAGRAAVADALTAALPGPRLPWYGTSMSPASMATARLMETWAHGEDVADALGVVRRPTRRLRHIVRLGVRARDFAYAVHGLRTPAGPFRVEVRGPGGEVWAHGPADAGQKVTGDAHDFCRLVTQRVHRDDADVHAEGADADQWLDIAQAFAGPPGAGREPGHAGEARA
ncbi:TIGR03084 family metal-binding protein [Streptomyces diacarni]|uniref:TIGR03084 family metal-binding protein n=1 Tax=Streptomyces diacarni TaxID=2800381 RepID=UPI0033FD5005